MKSLIAKLLLPLFLFISFFSQAQVVDRPSPERLVNNLSKQFPDFLSAQQEKELEDTLRALSNNSSNQICVLIIDDINGMAASDYAVQLLNKWGVGQKDKNNGVVILVKPAASAGDRDLAISVGYGLEGAITDLETKHISENEIIPEFKQGNYFEGLMKGCRALATAARGEYNTKTNTNSGANSIFSWFKKHPIISILLVLGLFYLLSKGKGGGGTTYGRSGYRGYGGFGGFGGGSFGGGSSGGGWGGFGGGMGGGGGSSSKW